MRRHLHMKPILCVLFCIFTAAAWYQLFYLSKYTFGMSRYTISSYIETPIRIVHLSDLHGSQFGQNNQDLVDAVKREAPDLIFLTGDLIDDDTEDLSAVQSLIAALSQIAPVYASYGNHELDHQKTFTAISPRCIPRPGPRYWNRNGMRSRATVPNYALAGFIATVFPTATQKEMSNGKRKRIFWLPFRIPIYPHSCSLTSPSDGSARLWTHGISASYFLGTSMVAR